MPDPEFLLTALIVVLLPGTGVIYTVSIGLFCGWRLSIAAAVGCTMGILPHLAASVLGLSVVLHLGALAFQVLKYAGSAYLLYLAWSMWRQTGTIQLKHASETNRHVKIAVKGVLINILNPKLSIFSLAFLPQFISPDGGSAIFQMLSLSALFMAMTLAVFILYGFVAGGIAVHLIHSAVAMKWLQRSFAIIFASLAAKLALSHR